MEEFDPKEILDLIIKSRSSKENKRMFYIYNQLTGQNRKACFCEGKVQMIKDYLYQYLADHGYLTVEVKHHQYLKNK